MKLTKKTLINLIKEEIGKVIEGEDEGKAPVSDEVQEFIVDFIHDMLRQLEDMGVDRDKHYWTIQNVITDDAYDSYKHPNKLSYSDPGFSGDE